MERIVCKANLQGNKKEVHYIMTYEQAMFDVYFKVVALLQII